jgi:group I intron endonuclease
MNHYVYLTTNLVNGKQYIGDHIINFQEKKFYIGSGKPYFKDAVKKYGECNFFKEILEWFETKKEAFDAQEKYISYFCTLVPNGYNISPTGGLGVRGCHSDETKDKIGKSGQGVPRPHSKNHNLKIGLGNKGKTHTEKQNEDMRQKRLGKSYSQQSKDKMGLSHKGLHYNKKPKIEI